MMNYLDFCEELFDKLTQDINQDYFDSSLFGFNNLIDCNWTRGDGFTFTFKIPTLNGLIFHEHLDESLFMNSYLFLVFIVLVNQLGKQFLILFLTQ